MAEAIKTMMFEHEPRSLEVLHNALNQQYPEVKIIDLLPSNKMDHALEVDVVFFEVTNQGDMDDLRAMINHGFNVVVITNHEKLILEMLKLDILAFIIPPFDDQNLKKVVEKIKKLNLMQHITFKTDTLLHLAAVKKSETVIIPTIEGYEVIRINEIIRVEADRSYCNIFLTGGRTLIVSKPLREIETMLPGDLFFRSHQSHLFNVNAMQRFIKSDGGFAVMSDHSRVPVSKLKKDDLLGIFMKKK